MKLFPHTPLGPSPLGKRVYIYKKTAQIWTVFFANWLPERNSEITNSRVVSEVIAYHYRWHNKRKALVRGQKPEFIPKNRIVSKKEMRHYQYVQSYENPIEKAIEFQNMILTESLNQNQLARKLGISRVRVHQFLNLLKLPKEQQDYILQYGKDKMITERILKNKTISYPTI